MVHLKLRKFQPSTVDKTRTWLIVGRRGSGKSSMVLDILYHHRNSCPYAVVFSGTEDANKAYSDCIPPLFIHSKFDEAVLKNVLARQKKLSRQGKKDGCLIILDDVLYDKGAMNNETIKEIALNGRHYNCQLIVCAQYLGDLPMALRGQFDVVVIMREPSQKTRQKIQENWLSSLTLKQTCQLLDNVCQNFEALVVINYLPFNNIDAYCFWYKASLTLPKFRVGASSFWNFASKRFDQQWEDKMDAREQAESNKSKPVKVIIKRAVKPAVDPKVIVVKKLGHAKK